MSKRKKVKLAKKAKLAMLAEEQRRLLYRLSKVENNTTYAELVQGIDPVRRTSDVRIENLLKDCMGAISMVGEEVRRAHARIDAMEPQNAVPDVDYLKGT